jgi:hypothetical protein
LFFIAASSIPLMANEKYSSRRFGRITPIVNVFPCLNEIAA